MKRLIFIIILFSLAPIILAQELTFELSSITTITSRSDQYADDVVYKLQLRTDSTAPIWFCDTFEKAEIEGMELYRSSVWFWAYQQDTIWGDRTKYQLLGMNEYCYQASSDRIESCEVILSYLSIADIDRKHARRWHSENLFVRHFVRTARLYVLVNGKCYSVYNPNRVKLTYLSNRHTRIEE